METKSNLFKEYIKFKRNNQMQAIKHPFGKQIVCSSMLFLHVLSTGGCQVRSVVFQPNEVVGIETKQPDEHLKPAQEQAASASVWEQNQGQAKRQAKRQAESQAKRQAEKPWEQTVTVTGVVRVLTERSTGPTEKYVYRKQLKGTNPDSTALSNACTS